MIILKLYTSQVTFWGVISMTKIRKVCRVGILFLAISTACLAAWAAPPTSVKVLPESVDYPLIKPEPYKPPKGQVSQGDDFEIAFGVRRWLDALVMLNGMRLPPFPQFWDTLAESEKWLELYGGYGVLGHGEDVFTTEASRFRQHNRGY